MLGLARWCVAATFAVVVFALSAPLGAEGSFLDGGSCTPFPPDSCCGCWQGVDGDGNPETYCFDSTYGFSECESDWCPTGNHDCGIQVE
jgi:hypothetical protein